MVPPGDDRRRYVCTSCRTIHYQNPRMVVGCIAEWQGQILLCKRAIEPRHGTWTLPAGYLENGETVAEGARRETREESGATLGDLRPYGMYNIRHVNQIYLIFRGPLADLDFKPGKESLDVRLFAETEIPWGELAFPVIETALQHYFRDQPRGRFPFHVDDVVRRMGRPSAEGG